MVEAAFKSNGGYPPPQPLEERVRIVEQASIKTAGDLRAHEQVTETSFSALATTMGEFKESVGRLIGAVDKLTTAQDQRVGYEAAIKVVSKPKWWVTPVVSIGAVILAAVFTLFGAMASRIASDNDRWITDTRLIAESRQRPVTSTVTVNPAPAPAPTETPPPTP